VIVVLPLIDIYPAALYTLITFWGDNCHVHARPDPSSLWERVWLARLVCDYVLNKKQRLQYMWPPICTVQRHNFRVHHPHSSRYLSLPTTHHSSNYVASSSSHLQTLKLGSEVRYSAFLSTGLGNLRSPTSRIRTIFNSWDAISPLSTINVYRRWAD